jgi:hypothetical protein
MATVQGTLDQPLADAVTATRSVAGDQGYALAEAECGPQHLVFKKGVTAVSWGSQFTVTFEAVSPTQTVLTVSTHETFAITDWGRGKRASHRLLDALGAK